ncbi:hypothetical protein CFC21_060207 [Triticum aestivum]|uniref:Bifunctional inhibitor/plant lipid transfer protein/seed storage helical domain-containing protein n=2 Tax=Triticum aestivum TaxID=4565 RepID=A0A9R1GRX1_WHEAT|nr:uncharacterized protein LOC123099389 [Triticum aestivum]KAF7052048.1 hypothetical protein CFC21_060207 [Triticum aestivum]
MAIIKQSLIVLVLLICGAGGSTTPAPAPALLTQDNLCVGTSTSNEDLACVANVALGCFAENAVTNEATFTPCFVLAAGRECLAKDKEEPNKEHCIGLEISKQLLPCLGDSAWTCYNSITGYIPPVFIACFQGRALICNPQ